MMQLCFGSKLLMKKRAKYNENMCHYSVHNIIRNVTSICFFLPENQNWAVLREFTVISRSRGEKHTHTRVNGARRHVIGWGFSTSSIHWWEMLTQTFHHSWSWVQVLMHTDVSCCHGNWCDEMNQWNRCECKTYIFNYQNSLKNVITEHTRHDMVI